MIVLLKGYHRDGGCDVDVEIGYSSRIKSEPLPAVVGVLLIDFSFVGKESADLLQELWLVIERGRVSKNL